MLAFNVEWFDSNAQIVRNYRLNCYNDETLELVRRRARARSRSLSLSLSGHASGVGRGRWRESARARDVPARERRSGRESSPRLLSSAAAAAAAAPRAQINEEIKQNVLKRIHYPTVQPTDLFLGATVNVFSRKLQIVAYTDLGTKKFMEGQTSRAVGVMGLPSAASLGAVLDALMGSCRITAAKTVRAADVGLGEADAPSGLALCVEAVTHSTDAPAILAELLDALAADGLVGAYAPVERDAELVEMLKLRLVPPADALQAASAALFAGDVHNSATGGAGRTLCIVKPHVLKQGKLLGALVADMAAAGFAVACAEVFVLDTAGATEFFEVYKGVLTECVSGDRPPSRWRARARAPDALARAEAESSPPPRRLPLFFSPPAAAGTST